jgi:hypothetical protein
VNDELSTPQQRLAVSRRALLDRMQGVPEKDTHHEVGRRRAAALDRSAWGAVARKAAQRWWRRHPANAVGQLARPLLERYAREQPAKLIAAAAATGALAVLIRPWRLLSVTAVVAALLKSSDVADIVTTLMHKAAPRERNNEP